MYAARVERGGEQWEVFQLVVEQGFQGGRETYAWGKNAKGTPIYINQHADHACENFARDVKGQLLKLKNVFLLPHLGSATTETREAMGMRVYENIKAFFQDEEPRDRVV